MNGTKGKIDPKQAEARALPRVFTGAKIKVVLRMPDGREVECRPFTLEDLNYTSTEDPLKKKDPT
jgi:hypothetical protein